MRDLQAKNNKVMGRSWQSRLCWIEAVVQSSKYPVTALQRRAVPGCHLEMCDRKSACQPEIEGQMFYVDRFLRKHVTFIQLGLEGPRGFSFHDICCYVCTLIVCIRDGRPAPPRPAPRKKGCPAPPRPAKKQILPRPAPQKLANPAGRGGAKLI